MVKFGFNKKTIEDFRKGMCFLLAHSLFEKVGWKMFGLKEERFILHAFSVPNSGGIVDVGGYFLDRSEFLSELSYDQDLVVEEIEASDMEYYVESYTERESRYSDIISERILRWHKLKVDNYEFVR